MSGKRWSTYILLVDLIWIAAALFLAGTLRYGPGLAPWPLRLWGFLITACALWVLLSSTMELDGFRGGWRFAAVVAQVFIAVACEMAVLLAIGYLVRQYVSRLALGYFGFMLLFGFIAIRCAAWLILRARHRTGALWRVVVIGSGRVARELAHKIERHPELLCQVVGLLLPDQDTRDEPDFCNPGIRESIQLSSFGIIDLLCSREVDEVILALPQPALPDVRNLVARCHECGIYISVVPQPYELYLAKPRFLDIDGVPVLEFRRPGPSPRFLAAKRVMDLGLGALMALSALPILVPAALVLKITKHRAFRAELRCGRSGQTFSMLRLNVERQVVYESKIDRLLDMLSITELPQLWNVLRGHMSLVGPRPEPPAAVSRYSDWHQHRLNIKPGMAGLAQVHGLREQNSSEQKAKFDLQYLMNPSLLQDFSLLLQTLWTLATRLMQYSEPGADNMNSSQPETTLFQDPLSSAHRTQPSAD